MNKFFYERNDELINHHTNKYFEEIHKMSDIEFRQWMKELREYVVYLWDVKGLPPKLGYTEQNIIDQFRELEPFDTSTLLVSSVNSTEKDIIRNTSNVGNAVNQWFPTMMKTKISYNGSDGLSIYDHFKEDGLFEKTITYGKRHFQRDSFYHYSHVVKYLPHNSNKEQIGLNVLAETTAKKWIIKFENTVRNQDTYSYWLQAKDSDVEYTGYNLELKNMKCLQLSQQDVEDLGDLIPNDCKLFLPYNYKYCLIRVYALKQKLFPLGLKAFRISWCQQAVNFPPLTAKLIYEKYTKHIDDQDNINIWDPSSGWGGRLLGFLSLSNRKNKNNKIIKYNYLGTDPNTDHNTPNNRTKYHEFADYYNNNVRKKRTLFNLNNPHTYEIIQCGSEVIKDYNEFKKYENNLDLVFTSPPYFCKEIYSQDKEQSCNKFVDYESWKEGFLYPTLLTAITNLKKNRYLLWNISDVKMGKYILPLEEDSCNFIISHGLEYVETLKMTLAQMPGGNRTDDTDNARAKNCVQIYASNKEVRINGKKEIKTLWLKYEPIFVFLKK